MSLPVIAIVGRPNVGKSMLFNKLIGKRLSITEDTPGVTRDRLYAEGEWLEKRFLLVDTGGIEINKDDPFLPQMAEQAKIAIDTAEVIIFVTDIRTGITAADADISAMLRKSGKPVVLCVNKADSIGQTPAELYDFYNLGLGEPFPVSAVHGHGTGDLLDEVFRLVPEGGEQTEDGEAVIKVAVIGKPNVGKSSLINKILGQNRMIVSDVAGTTRDAIDSYVTNKFGSFVFIDTAGIRRKSRVSQSVEKFSVLRAFMAVERADVAVIMLDARDGVTDQDTKIAGFAHEKGKACVIAANKWDITEKTDKTMSVLKKAIENDLGFMSYAPSVFISAETGQRIEKLFELIKYVHEKNNIRISTGVLNELLADAVMKVQPPSDKGRRLKIFYMTQASTAPPTFVVFVNSRDLFHFSYQRYLENCIRTAFGLDGTPVRFIVRERGEKDK